MNDKVWNNVEMASDEDLFEAIKDAVNNRLRQCGCSGDDLSKLAQIRPLTVRATLCVWKLDVSMAFDDLGWHFYNFNDWDFQEQVLIGLRHFNVHEAETCFGEALKLVEDHWGMICEIKMKRGDFKRWYRESGLQLSLDGMNQKLWSVCDLAGEFGLLSCCIAYARLHPESFLSEG